MRGKVGVNEFVTANNDRFIIVDQEAIFRPCAPLKDASYQTSAVAKMVAEAIPGLLESTHKAACVQWEYGKGTKIIFAVPAITTPHGSAANRKDGVS